MFVSSIIPLFAVNDSQTRRALCDGFVDKGCGLLSNFAWRRLEVVCFAMTARRDREEVGHCSGT